MTGRKALEPLQETIQAAGPPAVGRVSPGAVRVRALRVRAPCVRTLCARIAAVRAVRVLTAGAGPVRGGLPGRCSRRRVRRGRVHPGEGPALAGRIMASHLADCAVRRPAGPPARAGTAKRNLIDVNVPWRWDERTIRAGLARAES